MNIGEFNPSTFKPAIVRTGPISSDELRSFSEATVNDLASLSSLLNDKVLKILATLPETTEQNALLNGMDAKALYVNNSSTINTDNGLFFNVSQNRPMSVYESLLLMIQIIANTENGLREGVAVGTITSPIPILNGGSVEFEWPYFDGIFEAKLYAITGSTITSVNNALTIEVNYSNKKIYLINNSGFTVSVYGFLWHPVFSF
jgi:hypothetical protein